MDDGVATVGVDGEVALLVGVDVDLSVSVDTKPAQEFVEDSTNSVANTVSNDVKTVTKETTKVVDKVAEPVNNAGNAVVGGVKDTGNAIGSVFGGGKKKKKKGPFGF